MALDVGKQLRRKLEGFGGHAPILARLTAPARVELTVAGLQPQAQRKSAITTLLPSLASRSIAHHPKNPIHANWRDDYWCDSELLNTVFRTCDPVVERQHQIG
jgi:hypothetical protein